MKHLILILTLSACAHVPAGVTRLQDDTAPSQTAPTGGWETSDLFPDNWEISDLLPPEER